MSQDASRTVSKATPVGQLVAERPARACILEAHGIDYCCGGKATLEEACRKKGIRVEEVLEKLIAADQKEAPDEVDWTTAKLKNLVEHIVAGYHEPMSATLELTGVVLFTLNMIGTFRERPLLGAAK